MNIDVALPELGENIEKGDIVKWLVKVGDIIQAEQPILEIETGKAVVEVPSPAAGRVGKLHFEEGDAANVGDVVLTLEGNSVATPKKTDAPKIDAPKADAQKADAPKAALPKAETRVINGDSALIPAAPGVKRAAREAGIDLNALSGSGAAGRITLDDVMNRIHGAAAPVVPAPASKPTDFSQWGEIERKPMSNVRKATAEHLWKSWGNTPQVTQYDKADITPLELLRKKHAGKAEAAGGKLTMTAIAIKICAIALERFPQFNTSIDMNGGIIIQKKYVNVGVAVDTERGLLVPVIRDCNKKGIIEISAELAALSEKARKAQLGLEAMQGGCFSISNLGGIGGVGFSPIVNSPEVAILGMSRADMEPRWNGTTFEPRLMLPLSLSYDHRQIDGADAARFLRFVCAALEEPMTLMF
jgi:pyruvate dehydrogenase E2 component (dihydrolipoamide acetyltransferase)